MCVSKEYLKHSSSFPIIRSIIKRSFTLLDKVSLCTLAILPVLSYKHYSNFNIYYDIIFVVAHSIKKIKKFLKN